MKRVIHNKGGVIPIMILIIGVFALCTLAIVSFLMSGKINRTDDIGVEATNFINSKIEAFDFYVSLGFPETEAAEKIGARTEGDILILEEKIYSGIINRKLGKDYISVEYRRKISLEVIQPEAEIPEEETPAPETPAPEPETAIPEEEPPETPSSVMPIKSYTIENIGFSFDGNTPVYGLKDGPDVLMAGKVNFVVNYKGNCDALGYQVWEDRLFDKLVSEKTSASDKVRLERVDAILNAAAGGKYHVDVFCFDSTGKIRHHVTSANLIVPEAIQETPVAPPNLPPVSPKTYRINQVGFRINDVTSVYDKDIIRLGTIKFVVDFWDNCYKVEYQVWQDKLFDTRISPTINRNDKIGLEATESILNSRDLRRGKYHVDVFCFDSTGKIRHHVTSKNMEVR